MRQTNVNRPERIYGKAYPFSWIIILVLGGSCLYLLISKSKLEKENRMVLIKKQQMIDSVTSERSYLQADFNAATAKIDLLMSKSSKLTDSLQRSRLAISALQKQIGKILNDKNTVQADLIKARNMLYLLIGRLDSYEEYIAQLEIDNGLLSRENEVLSDERDKTVEKNIALKIAGSVLHVSNIRTRAVHNIDSRKRRETSRASNTDEIVITYDIDENHMAESGTKRIYTRIVSPSGSVLYIVQNGSGLIYGIDGDELKFSLSNDVDFVKNKPLKNVSINWKQKDSFFKGTYKIELYNLGYKIGESSIVLR